MISKMSLRQKIGQMIMPDIRHWIVKNKRIPFTQINSEVKKLIDKYQFGGFILFADNIVDAAQIIKLNNDLQKVMTDKNRPAMFISIDQEGGFVSRLPLKPRLSGNMSLGAANENYLSFAYGWVMAKQLLSLGINVNFAPDIDVNNNPNNPVIGLRSISSSPKIVADHALALIQGMQDNNLIAVAKHFPGHGDVSVDSHLGLPIINKTILELEKTELLPFIKVIKEVDMIMTAHIANPKIDPSVLISTKGNSLYTPATISSAVLTGILRQRLNFEGIIITDAMSMGAMANNFDCAWSSVEAIKAGSDIILMPVHIESLKNENDFEKLFLAIHEAVSSGYLKEEQIDKSVKRILELKKKRGILDFAQYKVSLKKKIADANKIFNSPNLMELEMQIAQKAITVVKDDEKILPVKLKDSDKVLLLGERNQDKQSLVLAIENLFGQNLTENPNFDALNYFVLKDQPQTFWKELIKKYDYIIVVSKIYSFHKGRRPWQISIIENIINFSNKQNKKLIIISAALPYDIAYYSNAKIVLACYGSPQPTNNVAMAALPDMPNISAAISAIFGFIPPQGTLPVSIPKVNKNPSTFTNSNLYPQGHRLN
jgi:beta-N-acetylhexosaminidase